MAYTHQLESRFQTTWLELNAEAVELLLAVTVLLGSASLFAMASGEPETMALLALTGIGVVLLGTALVRLSEYLRTTESPLP